MMCAMMCAMACAMACGVTGANAEAARVGGGVADARYASVGTLFEREAPLGKKKWWKKIKKSVSNTASTVSNTVVNTATSAGDWVANTALESKAVQKFGAATVKTFESAEIMEHMDKYYSATKGWTVDTVNELASETAELAKDIQKVAEMIAEFFNGLNCNVDVSSLKKFMNTLVDQAGSSRINQLVDLFNGDRENFWNNLGGTMCDSVWLSIFPAYTVVADTIKAFVTTLKSDCPAAMTGGDLPAFALGFVVAGDISNGGSYGVGSEIAVGVTLTGERFCYVAGCAYSGITLGDPGAGGTAGVQVTGYKSIASVPGTASFLSLGVGIEIPGTPVGGEAGISYIYSGKDLSDIIGIGFMGGGSLGTDTLMPASVTLSKGVCNCPVCVTTTGVKCGDKEASQAIGVDAAARATEAAALSAALGNADAIPVDATHAAWRSVLAHLTAVALVAVIAAHAVSSRRPRGGLTDYFFDVEGRPISAHKRKQATGNYGALASHA